MDNATVITRLRSSKGHVARIARETNMPYKTLRKIVTGETIDPRSSTLETLREYFQKQA